MHLNQRALRAILAGTLFIGSLTLAGCSRPTPGPGQQTPAPTELPAGYPAGGGDTGSSGTPAPQPGEAGYPPPKPTDYDPYPGKTQTAAAGGSSSSSATEAPAAGTATP